MNKRQKEVQQAFLDSEKATLEKLKRNYAAALKDINGKLEILMARQDADMQHVIYQVEYQKALKAQVTSILDNLHANNFESVSDYLTKSYEDGFMGSMYDMQGQGVPLVFPIDQKQVATAIQQETKLSENLYNSLGKDIKTLNKQITSEISRGISTAQSYKDISRSIADYSDISRSNAMRIARTEGHRIQCKAASDAQHKAKEKGADVVKQWDSSLDGRTRTSHREVDGEIRELDKKFSNGLMYPGDPSAPAAEVVNCRCALLQRARWALENDYTKRSPAAPVKISDDGTTQFVDMSDAKNYESFKKQYNAARPNDIDKNIKSDNMIFKEAQTIEEAKKYMKDVLHLEASGFEGVNIDVANAINREITKVYDVFGDLHNKGVLDGIRILPNKQSYVAAYSKSMKEVFFVKDNVGYKSSLAKMKKNAALQFASGFWSTPDAEHSIRHELGHAIDHAYLHRGNKVLNQSIADQITMLNTQVANSCGITYWDMFDTEEHNKLAGDKLSYYGLKTDGEFIAESVAEYMSGNPRETAKKVVELLLKAGG